MIRKSATIHRSMRDTFHPYRVSRSSREELLDFMVAALKEQDCDILYCGSPTSAPFRLTFETREGDRIGIIAYAFYANNKPTRNRPFDEHRFQIKYGGDLSGLHEIWQDPYEMYVTLLLGINPELGFFVAIDPVLHNPTRFSVSVEFTDEHVEQIHGSGGWYAWERERRGGTQETANKRTVRPGGGDADPLFEVVVGGTRAHFLKLVRFEREALGEAPGERHLLADRFGRGEAIPVASALRASVPSINEARLHALAADFKLDPHRVLDLIEERRRLKVAVRGAVAEAHLVDALGLVTGVGECGRVLEENGPDVRVVYGGRELFVECKNSSRRLTAGGLAKIDFQRTRAAKSDPCSRYYSESDFDIVAACTHAVTERWEFKYARTAELAPHASCRGKLASNVRLDSRWSADPRPILDAAAGAARR